MSAAAAGGGGDGGSPAADALALAVRLGGVFPCSPRDKRPLLPRLKDAAGRPIPKSGGLNQASDDPVTIAQWWQRWPGALIGVAMGRERVFVIDFDPRTDAATGEVFSLDRLKAELEAQMGCPMPESLTSRTPSGGVHVYLRWPDDGGAEIRNRGCLPLHVDVRALGGYVIAPPGTMEDGRRYRWLRERPIADAPAALIEILRAPKAREAPPGNRDRAPATPAPPRVAPAASIGDMAVQRYAMTAFEREIARVGAAVKGTRNTTLNEAAYVLGQLIGAGALGEGMVRGALSDAARRWEDLEQSLATIDSGITAGMAAPRDLSGIGQRRASDDRSTSRPSPPGPPDAGEAGQPGRVEGWKGEDASRGRVAAQPERRNGVAEKDWRHARRVASGWIARRCGEARDAGQADEPRARRTAFGAGQRVAAGLVDAPEAEQAMQALAGDLGIDATALGKAMGDGMGRPLDPERALIAVRGAALPLTDLGNAERFRMRFGEAFRYTTAKGWLGWDGRRWRVLDQENQVTPAELLGAACAVARGIQEESRAVRDSGERSDDNPDGLDYLVRKNKDFVLFSRILSEWGRASESAARIGAMPPLARQWMTVPIEAFDTDPLIINAMNGTIRMTRPKRGEKARIVLDLHDRADMITRLAPVDFDPGAGCPVYDALLEWAQPVPAKRRYLHQWAGYSATGDVSEQKLHFWYGKGANGKSTVIDAWAHALGDYAGTIGIETFLDQGIKKRGDAATPDLARLGGVRLLRASEPERGARLNEALIKAATGGEPMAVRALHKGFFDLRPAFKLTMAGNSRPDIPGTDEGIWRRVRLIPWEQFRAEGERDETLPDKLRSEAAGIFRRIVSGALDWLTNGLVEPDDVTAATLAYREDSDPLARFLRLCTVEDSDARVQSSVLHGVFIAWCRAAGEKEWSAKGFSRAMADKGFAKKASDGMQWLGIRLVRQASDFIDEQGKVVPQSDRAEDGERASGRHAHPPWGDDDTEFVPDF